MPHLLYFSSKYKYAAHENAFLCDFHETHLYDASLFAFHFQARFPTCFWEVRIPFATSAAADFLSTRLQPFLPPSCAIQGCLRVFPCFWPGCGSITTTNSAFYSLPAAKSALASPAVMRRLFPRSWCLRHAYPRFRAAYIAISHPQAAF